MVGVLVIVDGVVTGRIIRSDSHGACFGCEEEGMMEKDLLFEKLWIVLFAAMSRPR